MTKFPIGFAAVQVMERIREENIQLSNKALEHYKEELEVYGTAISTLYQIATCTYGCRGGDHTFEYLAGRAFNLACSAFTLIQQCYYDEALNQIRSLGELANLQSLFWSRPEEFEQWKTASRKERLNNFSQAKIRDKIVQSKGILMMNKNEYAELCELGTHITPETQPNVHNIANQPTVGGIFQENGMKIAIGKLVNMTIVIGLGFSKMLNHNEPFEQLAKCVESMKDKS